MVLHVSVCTVLNVASYWIRTCSFNRLNSDVWFWAQFEWMCHERMSFALLLMYTFFAMPSKLDPWCPFIKWRLFEKSGLLLLWRENWQPLNFCVMSLNLHTCLVAKFNRVFSLFSYCKCYLVASTGILLGGGVVSCQSNILSYKLGHFYELLHVLVLFLEHLNINLSQIKSSQQPKTALFCMYMVMSNLTTWYNSYILVQASLVRVQWMDVLTGNVK